MVNAFMLFSIDYAASEDFEMFKMLLNFFFQKKRSLLKAVETKAGIRTPVVKWLLKISKSLLHTFVA